MIDRYARPMGFLDAQARVAHTLCMLAARIRITNPDVGDEFRFPLTQVDIGDAVGLTSVSVSRAWTQLEREGLVKRGSKKVKLLNEEKLKELCHFEDRYSSMDTHWFPG